MQSRSLARTSAPDHRQHWYRGRRPQLEESFLKPVVAILTMRRQFLGISQEELNFEVGCADSHLSKWEAGTHQPSIYSLLLWCEALDYRLVLKERN